MNTLSSPIPRENDVQHSYQTQHITHYCKLLHTSHCNKHNKTPIVHTHTQYNIRTTIHISHHPFDDNEHYINLFPEVTDLFCRLPICVYSNRRTICKEKHCGDVVCNTTFNNVRIFMKIRIVTGLYINVILSEY